MDCGVVGAQSSRHKRTAPKTADASPGKQRTTGSSRAVPGGKRVSPSETVAEAQRPTVRDQRTRAYVNAAHGAGVTEDWVRPALIHLASKT